MADSDRDGRKSQNASVRVYARPTPKMARRAPAKVLTPAEKAAFLARRPDLAPEK